MHHHNSNDQIVRDLRKIASDNGSIRDMLARMRMTIPDLPSLTMFVTLTDTFYLDLHDLMPITRAECFCGYGYSDKEIDQMILPKIAAKRSLWESPSISNMS